jgi:hypothetical protein
VSAHPAAGARAPDLIEPVIGFRQWRVRDGRLYSPFTGDAWDETELRARCTLDTHDPRDTPATDCGCGVYAYYDQPPRSSAATRDLVIGAVVLWGELELHGGGMRASHARIVGLALPPTGGRKRRLLVAAAARLQVPAVPFRRLRRLAGQAGAPVPATLRPPRTALPWECPMGLARTAARPRALIPES